jgi:hypothetical protein
MRVSGPTKCPDLNKLPLGDNLFRCDERRRAKAFLPNNVNGSAEFPAPFRVVISDLRSPISDFRFPISDFRWPMADGRWPPVRNLLRHSREIRATVYGYVPSLEGAMRFPTGAGATIDVKSDTLIDNTELALMGAFEVQKGRCGGFADAMYFNVAANRTNASAFDISGGARTERIHGRHHSSEQSPRRKSGSPRSPRPPVRSGCCGAVAEPCAGDDGTVSTRMPMSIRHPCVSGRIRRAIVLKGDAPSEGTYAGDAAWDGNAGTLG